MSIFKRLASSIREKLNPAQQHIHHEQGGDIPTYTRVTSLYYAYHNISAVNRGVNFIVDSLSGIVYDIGDKLPTTAKPKVDIRSVKRLNTVLNFRPNPFQTSKEFYANLYIDFLLEGNIFIYYDGIYLYHLPAPRVSIVTDEHTYVSHYEYETSIFYPSEIIHVKDNSAVSIFRGTSRLVASKQSMEALEAIDSYFTKHMRNGTISRVVLETEDVLGPKMKESIETNWTRKYSAANNSGGTIPIILDSGMKADTLGTMDMRELDLPTTIKTYEDRIYEALGIPPVLMVGGNNANINPNLRLFYLQTVLPIANLMSSAFEAFFGFDIKVAKQAIEALQPDLREQANFLSTLTNSGIMTVNEARERLRLPYSEEDHADTLIIPANVAGSNLDASQGGRPEGES